MISFFHMHRYRRPSRASEHVRRSMGAGWPPSKPWRLRENLKQKPWCFSHEKCVFSRERLVFAHERLVFSACSLKPIHGLSGCLCLSKPCSWSSWASYDAVGQTFTGQFRELFHLFWRPIQCRPRDGLLEYMYIYNIYIIYI